jgi:hypothetical protein
VAYDFEIRFELSIDTWRISEIATLTGNDLDVRPIFSLGPRVPGRRSSQTNVIAIELGEWARGCALDQPLSGLKAWRELGL